MYMLFKIAVLAGAALLPGLSQAATLGLGEKGVITCVVEGSAAPAECTGFVSGTPATTDAVKGDLFKLKNSSEKSQADFLNGLLGGTSAFGADDIRKLDKNEVIEIQLDKDSKFRFVIDRPYFAVKIGRDHAFVRNGTNGPITVYYSQTGKGGGLSHVSSIGTFSSQAAPGASPVPLPPALALLLAGLGGLGVVGRRRHAAAKAEGGAA